MSVVLVHISTIRPGDTIVHNGKPVTVCKNNIKRDQMMGVTVFGDSYLLGNKLVEKVI